MEPPSWTRKPMTWNATVSDTYADSHVDKTAVKPGATADKAAQNKIEKYAGLTSTHIFYRFAVEAAGTWHNMAIQLTREIGRRITTTTEDTRETTLMFQRQFMALRTGNAVSYQNTVITE